ncbi:hypothetical protein BX600DRAFT_147471 [Xylariales sp. PMI_506]|nr:hypothetical protein BX600DRAFT_147471 [Xylariales sp. PMI_506]
MDGRSGPQADSRLAGQASFHAYLTSDDVRRSIWDFEGAFCVRKAHPVGASWGYKVPSFARKRAASGEGSHQSGLPSGKRYGIERLQTEHQQPRGTT